MAAPGVTSQEQDRGLLGQIEVHSIDWIPDPERHGKTWQQSMLWFLGNFQYFTIPIGFVGPALGLSLGWSILAGILGIAFGTLFMAFHATQGPVFGLPQMIQTRAQLGYRGVVVALFAVLFTYMAFNVADQVLLASGLHGAFGWNAHLVAIVTAVLAAALAIFGYDWVHRVFRFLLVISLPCYAIITIAILVGHAGGTTPHHPGGFLFAAFMAQFSVAAAYNITYAPYVSDYSRYMPRNTSPRWIIGAVFFGASGSAVWLIALGAWLATRLGVNDGLVGLQSWTDADRADRATKRICPATGLSVAASWEAEKPFLRPLPEFLPEPFDLVKTVPVHKDTMVHFEGRSYAVPFAYTGREVEVRGCSGRVQILDPQTACVLMSYPRHTQERILIDPTCYEGPGTAEVIPPKPLGRMARKLQEIASLPVERRPIDLYAAVAEVAR